MENHEEHLSRAIRTTRSPKPLIFAGLVFLFLGFIGQIKGDTQKGENRMGSSMRDLLSMMGVATSEAFE